MRMLIERNHTHTQFKSCVCVSDQFELIRQFTQYLQLTIGPIVDWVHLFIEQYWLARQLGYAMQCILCIGRIVLYTTMTTSTVPVLLCILRYSIEHPSIVSLVCMLLRTGSQNWFLQFLQLAAKGYNRILFKYRVSV